MKLKKTYSCLRIGSFMLMAVYIFIVAAHLFFAPAFQADGIGLHHSFFKRNNDLVYILIRTNRSTTVESKTGKISAKQLHVSFNSLLTDPKPSPHTLYGTDHISQFSPDLHSSYLSNRILRI